MITFQFEIGTLLRHARHFDTESCDSPVIPPCTSGSWSCGILSYAELTLAKLWLLRHLRGQIFRVYRSGVNKSSCLVLKKYYRVARNNDKAYMLLIIFAPEGNLSFSTSCEKFQIQCIFLQVNSVAHCNQTKCRR